MLEVFPSDPFKPSGSFNYTVSDGHGGTSSAVATVNYKVANSPPIVGNDTFTEEAGSGILGGLVNEFEYQFTDASLLANDSDPNGDQINVIGLGKMFSALLVSTELGTVQTGPFTEVPKSL